MELILLNLSSTEDVITYKGYLKKIDNSNPFYKIELLNFNLSRSHNLHYFLFTISGEPFALMPILLRSIKINGNLTPYFDAISPYGYSGPLYATDAVDSVKKNFWNAIDLWYKEHNVISEFIRFSLTNNHIHYSGKIIHSLNNVKGEIISEKEQWNNYKPKVRNNYRKAISNELFIQIVHKDVTLDQIAEFYRIYINTMRRNSAEENYFYSLKSFQDFILKNPDHCALAMVLLEKTIISVELVLLSNTTIYSFLGGTDKSYFSYRPNDFLKIEVLKWGRTKGYKNYVLGGGRKDNDSLYQYKKSIFYKDDDIVYYTGRKILNKKIYDLLVEKTHANNSSPEINSNLEVGFFPKYRDQNYISKKEMIKIIQDKETWDSVLKSTTNYDFYHTFDYHKITIKDEERSILFTYIENDTTIALPLIIRPIDGTDFFDATSAYGYVGPLEKNIPKSFNNKKFIEALNKFLNEEKIICIFSRLNPYIKHQDDILKGIGEIENLGKVVNIDITKDIATQRTQYSKSTKSRVNKARKECYVKLVTSDEEINQFIDIYYENMKRLNATDSYFFDREYFFNFYKSTDFKTDILMVFDINTDLPIAASMFVKTNKIIQFHLSGTKNDYLNIAPARVFIDEMRLLGTEEEYTFFNLGGGLGGKEDSLFDFKASFSKDFKDFKIWKYIANEEAYVNLVNKNEKLQKENGEIPNFFPLYRY